MVDVKINNPICDDEHFERGKRGKRGHRGERGETGPPAFPPILAAGIVNSDGTFLSSTGFASLSNPAVGQYTFGLTAPPALADNQVVVATILAGSGGGQVTFINFPGGFDVITYDATGTQENKLFSVVVFDLS